MPYISLEKAAQYEGLHYLALYMRIKRNPEAYDVKREPAENGGKERIFVSVSCLSVKAQRAYNADLDPGKDVREALIQSRTSDAPPWYMEVDPADYVLQYRDKYHKALDLKDLIEEYTKQWHLAEHSSERRQLAIQYAERTGFSESHFYKKVQEYREGSAWALKRAQEDGADHSYLAVLALCPEPREKNKFPSLTPEMKAFLENKCFDEDLSKNNVPMTLIYDMFKREADVKGWIIPSYHAVRRYLNLVKRKYRSAKYLAEHGKKEWKRNMMPKGRRDTKSLKVMEWVMGDAHAFDLWVEVTRANGKKTAIKPCLVGWMDVRSRALVGYSLCEVPDALEIKKSIINMIYPKADPDVPFEGVPMNILIDNGKEFTAESLGGRKRVERVYVESDIKGFYREIGIADDWRSLPFQPWDKAQIERFFGTICTRFSKRFRSYTGTLTGSKTAGKIKKDIKKMLDKGELPTFEQFAEEFARWLKEDYHVREHGGLKEQGDEWLTPIEVYLNAERYIKAAPPKDFSDKLRLDREIAHVYNTGILRNKHRYYHSALRNYIGEKVEIRYDRHNVAVLHVYDRETNLKICEAVCDELLQFENGVDSKKLRQLHKEKQNRALSETEQELDLLQLPYEERINLSHDKPSVGPELKEGNPSVTSLPTNKAYRQERAHQRSEKQREREEDRIREEYMKQLAKEALASIAQANASNE